MEAGKERLTQDAARDATRMEIESMKRENTELKHLVADLSLEACRPNKRFRHYRARAAAIYEPRKAHSRSHMCLSFESARSH
jgi:hypothetical protein